MSDAAIASIVTGIVTVALGVIGFLKLKYESQQNRKKIDENTTITRAGTEAAAKSASAAAVTATKAKMATEDMAQSIHRKLNGGLDAALESAIRPVREELAAHARQDEQSVREVNEKFAELNDYVHKRNHDVLDAMSTLGNRLELVLELIKRQQQPPPAG